MAVTTALVNAVPARSTSQLAGPALPFSADLVKQGVTISVTLEPARTGLDDLHVYVLSEEGRALDALEVSASLRLPAGDTGPIKVPLVENAPGQWSAFGFPIPIAGTWKLEVAALVTEIDLVRVRIDVPIRWLANHRQERRMSKARPIAALALAALVVLAPAAASAHVTVNPAEAEKGGFAKLAFRTPNERDDAGTVKLKVNFPPEAPFAFFNFRAVPGWRSTVERSARSRPGAHHRTHLIARPPLSDAPTNGASGAGRLPFEARSGLPPAHAGTTGRPCQHSVPHTGGVLPGWSKPSGQMRYRCDPLSSWSVGSTRR